MGFYIQTSTQALMVALTVKGYLIGTSLVYMLLYTLWSIKTGHYIIGDDVIKCFFSKIVWDEC